MVEYCFSPLDAWRWSFLPPVSFLANHPKCFKLQHRSGWKGPREVSKWEQHWVQVGCSGLSSAESWKLSKGHLFSGQPAPVLYSSHRGFFSSLYILSQNLLWLSLWPLVLAFLPCTSVKSLAICPCCRQEPSSSWIFTEDPAVQSNLRRLGELLDSEGPGSELNLCF